MKPSPHSSKAANALKRIAKAFTLIELLVVIVIIAILIALLFPALQAVKESANKVQAHNDESQIVTAVKAYSVEYGKYPVVVASGTASTDTYFGSSIPSVLSGTATSGGTNDVLFDVLRYNTANATNSTAIATLNTRGIVFLDVPSVHNPATPKEGVIPSGSATASGPKGAWYDPWGSQYNVLVDTGGDNSVKNPYSDTPGGATLSVGVIVWANGKNGALGGGSASSGFATESGSAGAFNGSGDILSWY